jgi:hypothetical protein
MFPNYSFGVAWRRYKTIPYEGGPQKLPGTNLHKGFRVLRRVSGRAPSGTEFYRDGRVLYGIPLALTGCSMGVTGRIAIRQEPTRRL